MPHARNQLSFILFHADLDDEINITDHVLFEFNQTWSRGVLGSAYEDRLADIGECKLIVDNWTNVYSLNAPITQAGTTVNFHPDNNWFIKILADPSDGDERSIYVGRLRGVIDAPHGRYSKRYKTVELHFVDKMYEIYNEKIPFINEDGDYYVILNEKNSSIGLSTLDTIKRSIPNTNERDVVGEGVTDYLRPFIGAERQILEQSNIHLEYVMNSEFGVLFSDRAEYNRIKILGRYLYKPESFTSVLFDKDDNIRRVNIEDPLLEDVFVKREIYENAYNYPDEYTGASLNSGIKYIPKLIDNNTVSRREYGPWSNNRIPITPAKPSAINLNDAPLGIVYFAAGSTNTPIDGNSQSTYGAWSLIDNNPALDFKIPSLDNAADGTSFFDADAFNNPTEPTGTPIEGVLYSWRVNPGIDNTKKQLVAAGTYGRYFRMRKHNEVLWTPWSLSAADPYIIDDANTEHIGEAPKLINFDNDNMPDPAAHPNADKSWAIIRRFNAINRQRIFQCFNGCRFWQRNNTFSQSATVDGVIYTWLDGNTRKQLVAAHLGVMAYRQKVGNAAWTAWGQAANEHIITDANATLSAPKIIKLSSANTPNPITADRGDAPNSLAIMWEESGIQKMAQCYIGCGHWERTVITTTSETLSRNVQTSVVGYDTNSELRFIREATNEAERTSLNRYEDYIVAGYIVRLEDVLKPLFVCAWGPKETLIAERRIGPKGWPHDDIPPQYGQRIDKEFYKGPNDDYRVVFDTWGIYIEINSVKFTGATVGEINPELLATMRHMDFEFILKRAHSEEYVSRFQDTDIFYAPYVTGVGEDNPEYIKNNIIEFLWKTHFVNRFSTEPNELKEKHLSDIGTYANILVENINEKRVITGIKYAISSGTMNIEYITQPFDTVNSTDPERFNAPTGTLRILTIDDANHKLYVYDSEGTRVPAEEFILNTGNNGPTGMDTINNRIFIVDYLALRVFVYKVKEGIEVPTESFNLNSENGNPGAIACSSTRVYITDGIDNKIYVYNYRGFLLEDEIIDIPFRSPSGLTIEGNKLYCLSDADQRIYVFNVTPGDSYGNRIVADEFNVVGLEDGKDLTGLTKTSTRFYIVNFLTNRIVVYNTAGVRQMGEEFALHASNLIARGITTIKKGAIVPGINIEEIEATINVVDEDRTIYPYNLSGLLQDTGTLSIENSDPTCAVWNITNSKLYVIDGTDKFVYVYDADFNRDTDSEFALRESNSSPSGAAIIDNNLWVLDEEDRVIYIYSLENKIFFYFKTLPQNLWGLKGLAVTADRLYLIDTGYMSIHVYDREDNEIREDRINLVSASIRGLVVTDQRIYMLDYIRDVVFVYNLNKERLIYEEFSLALGNNHPRGIGVEYTPGDILPTVLPKQAVYRYLVIDNRDELHSFDRDGNEQSTEMMNLATISGNLNTIPSDAVVINDMFLVVSNISSTGTKRGFFAYNIGSRSFIRFTALVWICYGAAYNHDANRLYIFAHRSSVVSGGQKSDHAFVFEPSTSANSISFARRSSEEFSIGTSTTAIHRQATYNNGKLYGVNSNGKLVVFDLSTKQYLDDQSFDVESDISNGISTDGAYLYINFTGDPDYIRVYDFEGNRYEDLETDINDINGSPRALALMKGAAGGEQPGPITPGTAKFPGVDNIYITDRLDNRVYIYDNNGEIKSDSIDISDLPGVENGMTPRASQIWIMGWYVSEDGTKRTIEIYKYLISNLRFSSRVTIQTRAEEFGPEDFIGCMAASSSRIFIGNGTTKTIHVYTLSGIRVSNESIDCSSFVDSLYGMTIRGSKLVIADRIGLAVRGLTISNGNALTRDATLDFNLSSGGWRGLHWDAQNNLYMALDTGIGGNHRVVVFDANGNVQADKGFELTTGHSGGGGICAK